ncbi:hypothetical protein MMC25_001769 [Agyrium rufum]|nr:hypothetical protein [Agyrium rufum]
MRHNVPLLGTLIIPNKLLLSYIFDWIIIILIALVTGLFNLLTPNHRPFSLSDPTISFPYTEHEKVSTATDILVSGLAPALIIVPICLFINPYPPSEARQQDKAQIWRRKLWEWNIGWMGLALALASASFVTHGSKNLFGKPRPDLLSRCQPDLENMAKYVLGGVPSQGDGLGVLVSWGICKQPNRALLNDGFQSFPSGHGSFSFAGLTYLTLFICAKLAIAVPYSVAPPRSSSTRDKTSAVSLRPTQRYSDNSNGATSSKPQSSSSNEGILGNINDLSLPYRSPTTTNEPASPPIYLLIPSFTPIAVAIYIASTRYSDFRHHGFDIIVGCLIGILAACLSFRWFHEPIRAGRGRSWSPRSEERAFVGHRGWGEGEGEIGAFWGAHEGSSRGNDGDLESGRGTE